MKLKQFGLLTAASLALVACSNESDPVMGGEDNAPKKVVLKLEGLSQGTKSTDANTSSTTVTLNDFAVFLYAEGGGIYMAKEFSSDAEDADYTWSDLVGDDATGYTFENVDPAVNRVLVIGNYANLKTNEAFENASSFVNSTVEALSAKPLSLKSQNQAGTGTDKTTKANITLFGKTESNITDSNGDGIYEAKVSIKPIVSRLEVKKVSCKFVTPPAEDGGIPLNATVTVNGIGLFDYYNTMTLDGTALAGKMDATMILQPGSTSEDEEKYVFLDNDAADWKWAYDPTTDGYSNTLTGDNMADKIVEMTKTIDKSSATFAYNFFPVTEGSTINEIEAELNDRVLANIRLSVEVSNSQDDDGSPYVVTTAFRSEGSEDFVRPEPGKIYQLDYAFETTNIREDWGDDNIKVNVIVKALDWVIVPVTPSF